MEMKDLFLAQLEAEAQAHSPRPGARSRGTRVDKAGQEVSVKTSDGAGEIYDFGRECAIETVHGLVDAARFTGKEGDHVVVYHTEEGGRKVAHLFAFMPQRGAKHERVS